ncbi:MAG: alpha/beta hydrolase [Rhodoblastus sp.]
MRLRVALPIAIAIGVAGCGGRPTAFLVPVGVDAPMAPGASRVDMLVATTRSPDGAAPGQMFTGERGHGLAFADIAVSIPPDAVREIGEVQFPSTPPGDPAKEFVTLRADRLDEAAAMARLHARTTKVAKRQALVFVHGYNTRFEEAVYRFAQIVHDSGAPVTPVLFTWPSRGKLLAYTYDRESANYSRDALETTLLTLVRDPAIGEISILAHSMGNWVTVEALRQMSIREHGIPKKISTVMLAAPDVDVDVFRKQIALIEEDGTRPDFTLFVSRDDEALAMSRRIWGSTARVGAIDPDADPYRAQLAQAKLRVVDMTDVKTADSLGHGKFAESPQIVQSIGARLASGQAISDGHAGLGEKIGQVAIGAAGTVGRAAGVVVSAPIAIVDGRTREGLSDQIEALGESASNTVQSTTSVGRR